jgi:hypothetical protein
MISYLPQAIAESSQLCSHLDGSFVLLYYSNLILMRFNHGKRQVNRYPTKDNLVGWADYAKRNSYQCDKAELRHKVGTEGANADFATHDVGDWKQPQRKEEGRGWAKAKATTSDNTYTGPGGSKRD